MNWIMHVNNLLHVYIMGYFTWNLGIKVTWQHKHATKNFDYTTVADRLRTVSWSNSSYPTGVVKPVYERSTFPLTATAVQSKGQG